MCVWRWCALLHLQVTVDDVQPMYMLESEGNLCSVKARPRFGKLAEFALCASFEYQRQDARKRGAGRAEVSASLEAPFAVGRMRRLGL